MKVRKKPVVVEAIQWTDENTNEILVFINEAGYHTTSEVPNAQSIVIQTLEGKLYVTVGDWVIKGIKGEFYPCKPDVFELTYEKVEE